MSVITDSTNGTNPQATGEQSSDTSQRKVLVVDPLGTYLSIAVQGLVGKDRLLESRKDSYEKGAGASCEVISSTLEAEEYLEVRLSEFTGVIVVGLSLDSPNVWDVNGFYTYLFIQKILGLGYRYPIVVIDDQLNENQVMQLKALSSQVVMTSFNDLIENGSEVLKAGQMSPTAWELIEVESKSNPGAIMALQAIDQLIESFGRCYSETEIVINTALIPLGVSLEQSPMEGEARKGLTEIIWLMNLAVREAFQANPERLEEVVQNFRNDTFKKLLGPLGEYDWSDLFARH